MTKRSTTLRDVTQDGFPVDREMKEWLRTIVYTKLSDSDQSVNCNKSEAVLDFHPKFTHCLIPCRGLVLRIKPMFTFFPFFTVHATFQHQLSHCLEHKQSSLSHVDIISGGIPVGVHRRGQ